jgi:hypothetical protein
MLSIRDYVLEGGDLDQDKISKRRVSMKYFVKALENVEPMSEDDLRKYEKLSLNTMYR